MKRRAAMGIGALGLVLWGGGAALLQAQFTQKELALGSSQMIGELAPPWRPMAWLNSEPLQVTQLEGKVVLLRFFHDSPAGAASLNELYKTYRERGLAVVGLYTPAPMPTQTKVEHLRRLVSSLGFQFPVGLDSRWETLSRYWLHRADAEATATTFLIDRKGIIRYIQPDGQYDKNSRKRAMRKEYAKLEKQVESLLKVE